MVDDALEFYAKEVVFTLEKAPFKKGEDEGRPKEKLHVFPRGFVDAAEGGKPYRFLA